MASYLAALGSPAEKAGPVEVSIADEFVCAMNLHPFEVVDLSEWPLSYGLPPGLRGRRYLMRCPNCDLIGGCASKEMWRHQQCERGQHRWSQRGRKGITRRICQTCKVAEVQTPVGWLPE